MSALRFGRRSNLWFLTIYDGLGEFDAADIAAAIREGRVAVVYANPGVEFVL